MKLQWKYKNFVTIPKPGWNSFSWGSVSLAKPGQTRKDYIDALRLADGHDYSLLLKFVRS